jgi:hypothetical protein
METFKGFGKHRNNPKGLQERISQALEDLPMAESRSTLDKEADE